MTETMTTTAKMPAPPIGPRPNWDYAVRVAVWFAELGRTPTPEEVDEIAKGIGVSTMIAGSYINVARCRREATEGRFKTQPELENYLAATGSPTNWREFRL